MGSGKDEVDPALAAAYAWRTNADDAAPPQRPRAPEAPTAAAPQPAVESDAPADDGLFEARDALAQAVRTAWEAPPREQRRAAAAALRALEKTQIAAAGLDGRGAARLWRLALRHAQRRLRSDRSELPFALGWAQLEPGPELGELLLEFVRADPGPRAWYAFSNSLECVQRLDRVLPDLGAPLAELARDPDPGRRLAALRASGCGVWPAMVEAAHDALRSSFFEERATALELLAGEDEPECRLRPEALAWLVEDLVAHPPCFQDPDDEDRACRYARQLVRALGWLRPAGALAPLRRILAHECAYVRRERPGFDDGFALAALAAAAPEEGRRELLLRAHSRTGLDTRAAVAAAADVPDPLAREALALLADHPAASTRQAACDAWIRRFGEACPPRTLGPYAALLEGPPSDDLERRLLVSDGEPRGRELLLEKVLAEPPSRENAVLLLHLFDGGMRWIPYDRARADELLRRYGEVLGEGLALGVERLPFGYGALDGAVAAVRAGIVPERRHQRLRAAARELLAEGRMLAETHALEVLATLGLSEDDWKRLWDMCFGADSQKHAMARVHLDSAGPCGWFDDRLLVLLARALAGEPVEHASDSFWLARKRCPARLASLFAPHVAALPGAGYSAAANLCCGHAGPLRELLEMPDAQRDAWLETPGDAAYRFAVRTLDPKRRDSDRLLAEAVLQDPRAELPQRLDVARRLARTSVRGIHSEPPPLEQMGVVGRCLPALLDACDLGQLADLLEVFTFCRTRLEPVEPWLVRFVREATAKQAARVMEHMTARSMKRNLPLLGRLLEHARDPAVRASIERALDLPNEAERYWRQAVEEAGEG